MVIIVIHSFNKIYTYYVPSTVLGARNTVGNGRDRGPILIELYMSRW